MPLSVETREHFFWGGFAENNIWKIIFGSTLIIFSLYAFILDFVVDFPQDLHSYYSCVTLQFAGHKTKEFRDLGFNPIIL